MGICEIASNELLARVSDDGAELVGMNLRGQIHNWIWSGCDPWKRRAPFLFPIVGRLRENTYSYEGLAYTLGQHGFARDQKFQIVDQDDASITLQLNENDDTLLHYPFKFSLQIAYQVKGKALSVSVKVKNTGSMAMYFSFGWHPAFALPRQEDLAGLSIVGDSHFGEAYLLKNGLLSSERKLVFGQDISLTGSSFDQDAWIFKDNPCQEITISDRDRNAIRVDCKSAPSLGVWSKDPSKFLCIEPWWGLPDVEHGAVYIESKPGIQKLGIGGQWMAMMSVTVSQRE